jgi:hypothetical protein
VRNPCKYLLLSSGHDRCAAIVMASGRVSFGHSPRVRAARRAGGLDIDRAKAGAKAD